MSAYTPAVINRSCISAISTGTAYFHSKRSAIYAEITINEAMIAITAARATVCPKVGPIELSETSRSGLILPSDSSTAATWAGLSCLTEIW